MAPSRVSVVALVTVIAILCLAAPLALALGLGWLRFHWVLEPVGSAGVEVWRLRDDNSIEAWVLLALAYLAWVPLILIAVVAVLDRLGYHYAPREREERPSWRERRRARAGVRYLREQEKARHVAPPPRKKA